MKKAIVLLSGGQDSTTCLYWALRKFGADNVIAIGFDYGQRHKKELHAAKIIADSAKVEYIIFPIPGILAGTSSLTDGVGDHNTAHVRAGDLPASFTPGRNMLFLTYAAIYAHKRGIRDIVCGVCQTDYSGYPDCRYEFIINMAKTISLAIIGEDEKYNIPNPFTLWAPLMYLTKAETWKLAAELNIVHIIRDFTITDYNGDTTENDWGLGKEDNPASILKAKGYREALAAGWLTPPITT